MKIKFPNGTFVKRPYGKYLAKIIDSERIGRIRFYEVWYENDKLRVEPESNLRFVGKRYL